MLYSLYKVGRWLPDHSLPEPQAVFHSYNQFTKQAVLGMSSFYSNIRHRITRRNDYLNEIIFALDTSCSRYASGAESHLDTSSTATPNMFSANPAFIPKLTYFH